MTNRNTPTADVREELIRLIWGDADYVFHDAILTGRVVDVKIGVTATPKPLNRRANLLNAGIARNTRNTPPVVGFTVVAAVGETVRSLPHFRFLQSERARGST